MGGRGRCKARGGFSSRRTGGKRRKEGMRVRPEESVRSKVRRHRARRRQGRQGGEKKGYALIRADPGSGLQEEQQAVTHRRSFVASRGEVPICSSSQEGAGGRSSREDRRLC
jgi:hypothetical protein